MLVSQRSRVYTYTQTHTPSVQGASQATYGVFHITSLSFPPATFSVGAKGTPVHPRRGSEDVLSHLLEHHAELLQGLLCHTCGVSVEEEHEDQDPSGFELPSLQ